MRIDEIPKAKMKVVAAGMESRLFKFPILFPDTLQELRRRVLARLLCLVWRTTPEEMDELISTVRIQSREGDWQIQDAVTYNPAKLSTLVNPKLHVTVSHAPGPLPKSPQSSTERASQNTVAELVQQIRRACEDESGLTAYREQYRIALLRGDVDPTFRLAV